MIKVLYADDKIFPYVNNGEVPNAAMVRLHYKEVCQMDDSIPEIIFCTLNDDPEQYIPELPEGVGHTSMSIGDILDNGKVKVICRSKGWGVIND